MKFTGYNLSIKTFTIKNLFLMRVVICYDCRLEAEQKEFYGDDLKDDEVYDESEEDISDSDQITTEIIQEELKKLRDIQMNRNTNSTSNISDATQDEILDTHTMKNEGSHSSTNFIQDYTLRKSYSPESKKESKDTNMKETRRISFAEPCVTEERGNAEEEEILIPQEACFTSKQDNTYENSEDADEDDTIRIEFSHSSHIPDIFESNNTEIQSPVDIYKMFSAPKSILKRSPNDMIYDQTALTLNGDSSTDTEDEDEYVKHSAYSSVSKNNNLIILLLHR